MRTLVLVLSLGAVTLPAVCAAQPVPSADQQQRRQFLIDQALQLRTRGEHARALALAEQAERIRATPSLLMLIALEHQALGNHADAYRYAQNCIGITVNSGPVDDREQVLARCRTIQQAAEQETALIELSVAPEVPRTASLMLADRPVSAGEWTVPQRVRGGSVVVQASAEGYRSFRQQLTVQPRTTQRVEVRMTRETPEGAPTSATTAGPRTQPPVAEPQSHTGWQAGLMIGGAVLAAGGVSALVYGHVRQEARAGVQSPTEYDRIGREAEVWKTVGHLALGAGAATLVSGLIWLIVDRPRASARRDHAWIWTAHPLPGGGMLGVGGAL